MARLTKSQVNARMVAYEELIAHLEQDWTDDPVELEQGRILRDKLRRESEQWCERVYSNAIDDPAHV